jgi:hypothetical protein
MRILYALLLLISFITNGFGHVRFMFIEVKPVSCQSFNYDVIIHLSQNAGSDILFGGLEVMFGDGTLTSISLSDFDRIEITKAQLYYKIVMNHAYAGPGKYVISAREFNRDADIKNMENSVQTPFYMENSIILDPVFGCNTPPYLENLPLFTSKSGSKYQFDFSVIDPDNDSVSFVLAHAYQDKNVEAVNFEIASEYDASGLRKISRVTIDPYTGLHSWNTRNAEGYYCIVLKMTEWKKIDGEYHQVSQSTIDYLVSLNDDDNNPPQITGLADTAIVAGNTYTNNFRVHDPEEDSVQMFVYGDFLKLLDHAPDNKLPFSPGPMSFQINYKATVDAVRYKPYKILISGTDQVAGHAPASKTASMHIWIAGRSHHPEKPKNIVAQVLNKQLIGVYWNDSNDELGYILERADLHFPEFEKLAVLPANITSFSDSSVVENNRYRYRVKAVGTQMSTYASTEISTPDIITSLGDHSHEGIKIYPNPSNGNFSIDDRNNYSSLQIIDIAGKTVFRQYLSKLSSNYFSLQLPSGLYILNLANDLESTQLKLEITP